MPAKPPKTETELIDAFARVIDRAGVRPRGLVLGVGDDTAIVRAGAGTDTLITKDVQVEGRHFQRRWLSGRELGARLAAVNLSDIAAMGGEARFALLSLVAPAGMDGAYLVDVVRGVVARLGEFGAALVGGNVSAIDGPLVCDLTLTGACATGKAWRRRARAGDAIVVAGNLGAAAAGLSLLESRSPVRRGGRLIAAYKRPKPLLDVARLLRANREVRGAIDVSDGLSTDLVHVCRASGVGCKVDGATLPISRATRSFCIGRGVDPIDWAMRGGEDYALVLSMPPKGAARVCTRIIDALGVTARVVGRFTRSKEVYQLVRPDGTTGPFEPAGWDHFAR